MLLGAREGKSISGMVEEVSPKKERTGVLPTNTEQNTKKTEKCKEFSPEGRLAWPREMQVTKQPRTTYQQR
jgi:hypothetical protein